MKKYEIGGKEKHDKTYCRVCRNGSIFTREYNTDSSSSSIGEHICGVCNTKYLIPHIDLGFHMEYGITNRIDELKMKEFRDSNTELTSNTATLHMIKIVEDYNLEVKKMNPVIEQMKEEYLDTGKCDNHMWVTSQPFKTPERSFTIRNCAVCKLGELVYKGVKYRDNLFKLIAFVADMGELKVKNEQIKAEIELSKLFEIKSEPVFGQSDGSSLPEPTFSEPTFNVKQQIQQPTFQIIDEPIF